MRAPTARFYGEIEQCRTVAKITPFSLTAVIEKNSHSLRNAVATAMHLRSMETPKSIGINW